MAAYNSELFDFEDEGKRVPKCHEATCGKQLVHEELAKKKKKEATPPPHKRGGITIREPTARRWVIADWTEDDKDGREMLQQRAKYTAAPNATTRVSDQ